LGQGAFGKVYLARQSDLANRPVVLKVAGDIFGESQTLAQLQHTNIVPIYSFHRTGPFQAVCMPYFGSTTLASLFHVLRDRPSLPASGKGLVDTLEACRSVTWTDHPTAVGTGEGAGSNGAPSAAPFTTGQAPALLKKLEQYSYVEAILWITARLADGLEHAHERGILHRDLKPANVLLTDEGQPMLLDFNLSEDVKLRSSASVARIGGTLPYMAPEHLDALQGGGRPVDARSDAYSLGVILVELLTGRHAFPVRCGAAQDILAGMIADRQTAPAARRHNPAVPHAVESIVRRCLAPEPSRRYQSARELREDLERQLEHFPLLHAPNRSVRELAAKWVRRHPRGLPTAAAVLAVATLVALGVFFVRRGERLADLQAREALSQFEEEMTQAQSLFLRSRVASPESAEGVRRGFEALERYRVLDDPRWQERPAVRRLPAEEQERLRGEVGDLLLLLARASVMDPESPKEERARAALRLNHRAEACYTTESAPLSLWRQRVRLAEQLGQPEEVERARQQEAAARPRRPLSAKDREFQTSELISEGQFVQALGLLREATREDPRDFWAWYREGVCHESLGDDPKAEACFQVCVALRPAMPWPYFKRGLAHLRQEEFAAALADFDKVLSMRPDLASAWINRALALQGLSRHKDAIAALDRALKLDPSQTRLFFLRARSRQQVGDRDGAQRDREEGLKRTPEDADGWIARGVARLGKDAKGALGDFEAALKLDPTSLAGLQNKAHVLAELLGRTKEAVEALDKAVEAYPAYVPSRAARGVLLARLNRRGPAIQDAEEALARDGKPATLYQVAGIYALTSRKNADDRQEAYRLLSAALRRGYGFDLLARDRDLDPIRNTAEFRRVVAAARAFREAGREKKDSRGDNLSKLLLPGGAALAVQTA
jgi:serine/threonine protein kinase/lipoprotein NlpI